jgi:hypothetical protein
VFAVVYAAEGSSCETLLGVARDFSPRVETCGEREVTLDLDGLTRLFGDAKTIAGELRRTAADRGLRVRIAIAGTRAAARLLVRDRAGITIVESGDEPAALEDLRIELLEIFESANPRTPEPANSRTREPANPPIREPPLSGAGVCAPSAISRGCRRTKSRRGSGRTAWNGSAWRAATIRRRSCRRSPKSGSSRRWISNGRSTGSSRSRSCSRD